MPTMRANWIVSLLLLLVPPTFAGADASLLSRLVSSDEKTREAAREEWDDLDDEERFAIGLAGLSSDDPDEAAFAAGHLDPWRIGLGDLRRRGRILAGRAASFFDPAHLGDGDLLVGLGAPDLLALWAGFAKLRIDDREAYFGEEGEWSPSDTFRQTHREMLPEHIPVLAGLLEAPDPVVFAELLWTLALASEFTDRYREDVARAMLHALERLGAPLAETPEGGLPASFRSLAAALWLGEGKPRPLEGDLSTWIPNPAWLFRWARDLGPGAADVPFLLKVVDSKEWLSARVWAIGALAGIDDDAARSFVAETAAGEGRLAPFAAAALARGGKPGHLIELLRRRPREETFHLALVVAPDAALRWWFETRPDFSWFVTPSERSRIEAELGLVIPEEVFRSFLEAEISAPELASGALMWFGDLPDLFTREMADELVGKVLRGPPPGGDDAPFDVMQSGLPAALAWLEIHAPERLSDVLAWLAKSEPPGISRDALRLLARLGDDRCVEETLAVADEMMEPDWLEYRAHETGADLGGLADPRLVALLVERARVEDRKRAYPALLGLLARHGLDRRLVSSLAWVTIEEIEPAVWQAFREAALAGDPVAALLVLFDEEHLAEDAVPYLGASGDPRAIAWLSRQQEEHTPLYWYATGGLALAGDEAAMKELLGLIRDARTVMLDELDELLVVAMEVDPSAIELVIDRLESNCCLGFYSTGALGTCFPTLDGHYEMHDFPQTRRRIREWYERHRGHFVWSRLVGGYVPGD